MESISGSTSVFGLIGDPIQHSLSPEMHNAAYRELKLNCTYVPFRVKKDDLPEAIKGIRSLNIKGVNVTTPHKEAVLAHLDEISEESSIIGAVNTIVNDQGKLRGHNTDGSGFVKYLKEEIDIDLKGKKILIVGLGGAAKSIALYLCKEDIQRMIIANRTPEKAEQYAKKLQKSTNKPVAGIPLDKNILDAFISKTDFFIYTLPTDLITGGEWPFTYNVFPSEAVLFDLRYYPKETTLMKIAREMGLSSHNGLGMLLYQGLLAFQIFTGSEPPLEVMKSIVMQ